jgi:hypothetical protein
MDDSEVNMRPQRQFLHAFVTILIVGMLAAPALARVRPETLPELAARSQWVGIARCVEAAAQREGARGMIFTVYRFERQASVSGQSPESFTLRIAGGTVGGFRVTIPDAPRFDAGRSYLVFLRPDSRGNGLLVAGAAGGVMPARMDAGGGWLVAVPQRQSPVAPAKAAAASAEGRTWIGLESLKPLLSSPMEGGRQ